jgi:GNAT superfamily N-acetyltransferase
MFSSMPAMRISAPRVVIRPALPADKESVLEFCKHIWDGEDYIHFVWDWWLADSSGEMFVAEYAGKAVGLARLTNLAPGQWWLEGFRVDPQHQDKRIGSLLHRFLVDHWLEHGDGTLRLWTNSRNVKVHHLCERTGFVKTEEHAIYQISSPLLQREGSGVRVNPFTSITLEDLPNVLRFTLNAESNILTNAMLDGGWCMATVNETSLQKFISGERAGRVLWWRERMGLLVVWENDDDPTDKMLMISFIASTLADFPALLEDARHYAAEQSYAKLGWNVRLHPPLLDILKAQGFTTDWDMSNFQFERKHPTLP